MCIIVHSDIELGSMQVVRGSGLQREVRRYILTSIVKAYKRSGSHVISIMRMSFSYLVKGCLVCLG